MTIKRAAQLGGHLARQTIPCRVKQALRQNEEDCRFRCVQSAAFHLEGKVEEQRLVLGVILLAVLLCDPNSLVGDYGGRVLAQEVDSLHIAVRAGLSIAENCCLVVS